MSQAPTSWLCQLAAKASGVENIGQGRAVFRLPSQLWDLDEVRLPGLENVPKLVDVVEDIVDEVLEFLFVEGLLLPILVLRLFLKGNIDQSQEPQVHLRVSLEIGPVVEDKLIKRHQLVLASEDVLAACLDKDVSHGQEAVFVRLKLQARVLLLGGLAPFGAIR